MLVLVSFGLVLLATILLVVGLLTDDGLTLIYFSIGASFTAAVVLYLAFRRARPAPDGPKVAPEPIAPEGTPEADAEAEATRVQAAATTPAPAPAPAPVSEPEPEPEPEPAIVPAGSPAASNEEWHADDDWADDGDFDVEFPIADYDDLTVAEIMPLLPQLYSDELGIVAERERTGKGRATILNRLDELAATGTEADAAETEVAPTPTPTPTAPAAAPTRVSPAATVPSLSDDEYDDLPFPIADYDELTVDQIVPLLSQLEQDELEEVKDHEVAGQGRKSVISEIDRQLGLDDGWGADEGPAASPRAEPAEGSALAIAGYDGLTVAQIRPLLTGLSDHELRAVLEHEAARDNRSTIINDIERRLESDAEAPAAARPRTPKKAAKKRATAKKATRATKKSAAKKSSAKKAARSTKKAAAKRFPIANYDELTVAEIRPRLSSLSDGQLEQVRERELSGAGRKTILNDIDGRLG